MKINLFLYFCPAYPERLREGPYDVLATREPGANSRCYPQTDERQAGDSLVSF